MSLMCVNARLVRRALDMDQGRCRRTPVYKHMLIATDGSELAAKAVTTGLQLAKALGAKVTAVTVTEAWAAMAPGEAALVFPVEEYEKAAAQNAAHILDGVCAQAQKLGVTCETVHVTEFPAEGIVLTAKDRGCDLIVMASHGRRGISRILLGSQAVRVLTHAPVPVLICR